jgi:hypothetical protein
MLYFFIFLFIIFCVKKITDYFIFSIKVYKFLLLINRIIINDVLVTHYITYNTINNVLVTYYITPNTIYNKKINISKIENIYFLIIFVIIHTDIYYNLCKVNLGTLQMFY